MHAYYHQPYFFLLINSVCLNIYKYFNEYQLFFGNFYHFNLLILWKT